MADAATRVIPPLIEEGVLTEAQAREHLAPAGILAMAFGGLVERELTF